MQAKWCQVVKDGDVSEGLQLERVHKIILLRKAGPVAIFQGAMNSCLCPWGPEILAMPLKLSMKDEALKKIDTQLHLRLT